VKQGGSSATRNKEAQKQWDETMRGGSGGGQDKGRVEGEGGGTRARSATKDRRRGRGPPQILVLRRYLSGKGKKAPHPSGANTSEEFLQ